MVRVFVAVLIILGSPLIGFSAGVPLDRPIEVRVEVVEVDQARASQLGIQWPSKVTALETQPAGFLSIGEVNRGDPFRADVSFLMESGAAELLANPNLVTDSGTTATFHAGGEIPYVTNSQLGSTHVEFKPYGVLLEINPQWVGGKRVSIKMKAAVSAPDQTQGVQLSGQTVPALLERQVSSHLTMALNQTVSLAGLVQTQKEERQSGVPFLRRIPWLGVLFRWKKTDFKKTTIIMFVTPMAGQ